MAVVTEFKWKLDNFVRRFINGNGNEYSDVFSLNDKPQAKLRAYIWNYSGIYLQCADFRQAGELHLISKFWIESGNNRFCEKVKACVYKNRHYYSDSFLTESDLDDLKKFIVDESVTLCFKIKFGDSIDDFDNEQAKMSSTEMNPLEQFAFNISKLHLDGYYDLTIQAGGKKFKAHKTILMGHSEIFKVMLSSPNSIEAQTSLIKIENIDAKIIGALVDWMHFLQLENLNEIALDLYKVAHKYQISPLMKVCTQAISNTLTVENLPSRVIFAYIYEVEELKCAIFKFVRQDSKNTQNLIASNEWIDFTYENRELAKKIAGELSK